MRLIGSISFVAILALSGGCSTSSVDDLGIAPRPSEEMTNSIARPVRPPEAMGKAIDSAPAIAPRQAAASARLVEPKRGSRLKPPPLERVFERPEVEEVALVAPDRPAPMPFTKPRREAELQRQAALPPPDRQKIYAKRFRDAKPINFGPSKPRDHAVHGVDVSRWQGNIDWARLRSQGANFAFIKATDGGDHIDPMFRKNWNGAHEAGLKRGAYHFFYWCRSAESQAKWFIRNVPKTPGALPPVIDVEWNHQSSCKKRPSSAVVREKMQVFMDRLEAHYGQRPIIYTAPDFYADNLKGAFPNHPFWLRAVAQHPSKVYPNRKWLFWQYSGSGLSHGVSGKIDLNAFKGSEGEWRQWVASNQH